MHWKVFLALFATTVLAEHCFADEKADPRLTWAHEGGQFLKSKDGSWYELNATTFGDLFSPKKYGEAKRSKEFIDLYDDSRRMYVRLFGDHAETLTRKGDWAKLFSGQWKVPK